MCVCLCVCVYTHGTHAHKHTSSAQQAEQSEHPFQCLDCGKSFRWSSRLTHHQRSHNNERPYRCNLCPKAFKGSSALLYHQRYPYCYSDLKHIVHRSIHTGVRAFLCPYCPLTFKWSSHYQYHLRQHTGECPYPCDSCPKAFKNSSSLRRHKNVHLGLKPYTCSVCNKSFTQSTNLRQHMRIHTGERPYVCGECGRSFTHSSNLALHKNSHSNPNTGLTLAPSREDVCTSRAIGTEVHLSTDTGASMLLYSCGSCNHTFGTRTELEQHQAIHMASGKHDASGEEGHGNDGCSRCCEAVGRSPTPTFICLEINFICCISLSFPQMHSLSSQSRSQFSCSACDRSFPLLSSLLTHQHSHTPEQRLLAEAEAEIVCPPSLSLSLPLPSSPSQAGSERPYRCLECGKAFKGSSGLKYHMRDHTGERPYRCTECGKSFKRSSLLSIHQRVHTGVRAFQCPNCPLTFKWSSHYQYHLRQHTGERPYVCKECGKSFKNTSCLRRHSQMHSGLRPHTCSICSKSFSQTSNLKQHERTHSGERPFQCTHCSKSFTHSSNLQLHLRTHSTSKDYKCPFCTKGFVMHSYLQRHIRTHGNGVSLPGGGGKDGVAVKASVGGVTTTTTLLNPITLETMGNNGSLIVSQPALNIPPNTSQNYFMIQTANGLQLIPLSPPAPAPPPPPPPPPPSQAQNFLLLQCPSTNGSQSRLILVPMANNPPPAPDPQSLPILQTIQAFQPILNQSQTQIAQFPIVSQQQQHAKIIITNTAQAPVATANHGLSALLTKPILGKSTRTARGRRGRKPKAALQKTAPATGGAVPVANCNTVSNTKMVTVNNTNTDSDLSCLKRTASITVASTEAATETTGSLPVTPEDTPHSSLEQIRKEGPVAEKHFVLCFENAEQQKQGANIEEGGDPYVLQFEGNPSGEADQEGIDGDSKSIVLQFESGGQDEGEKGGRKEGVMSLLHEWGEGKQGGSQTVGEESQGESYVLHFHTEAQQSASSSSTFGQGQDSSIELSCAPTQAFVPISGQEVVFDQMEPEGERGVQMIALIEGEGEMIGGDGAGCNMEADAMADDEGGVKSIFQLEHGDEIVIIEVSTSQLRGEEQEEEISPNSHVKLEGATAEKSAKEHGSAETSAEDSTKNGTISKSAELKFSE
uniref:C2H2-type domain-containing protein n=1 Tax=Xiphophorus couchianus TaxID=32473 RepID=A0A3B5KSM2_9TELE